MLLRTPAAYGGALYGIKSDVIEIHRTTFTGNYIYSLRQAGAICTHEHKTLVKIAEIAVLSQLAPKAGALHLGGDTEIFDTQFIETGPLVPATPLGSAAR